MAFATTQMNGQPLGELNTTPLIDVMLVLLVMFILAIPVATHSTEVDLPVGPRPDINRVIRPDVNKVVVTAGSLIMWNGQPVTQPQLLGLLRASTTLRVEPELQYQPDRQAPYDAAARVLAVIKGSGVSKFGFVGNEQFAEFFKPGPAS